MAFSLDMDPLDARASFTKPDNYIFLEQQTWVPVEATAAGSGFLNAWSTGAKQWEKGYPRT